MESKGGRIEDESKGGGHIGREREIGWKVIKRGVG